MKKPQNHRNHFPSALKCSYEIYINNLQKSVNNEKISLTSFK